MSEYGLLGEVVSEVRGSWLAAAASVSDTELVVEYAGDFDPEGGTLDLNGARLEYSEIVDGANPEDPDTLLLVAALAVAADEGDTVSAVIGGQIAVDYVAHVATDDGDNVSIPLRYDQIIGWPPRIYDPPIPVMFSEDHEHLEDAPGQTPTSGGTLFYQDEFLVELDGPQEFPLTYLPIENSEHLYWHPQGGAGIYQSGASEWSRTAQIVTIPDDLDVVRTNDRIVVEYAYLGTAIPTVPDVVDPDPPPDPEAEATLITPTGLVQLVASPAYTGEIHGDAPQWGDSDPGSYALIRSTYGTSQWNRFQGAQTNMEVQPGLVIDPAARIAVWFTVIANDYPYGFRAHFRDTPGAANRLSGFTGNTDLTAPEPWTVIELNPIAPYTIEDILTLWESTNDYWITITPKAPVPDPPGIYFKETVISEVRIAIYYP